LDLVDDGLGVSMIDEVRRDLRWFGSRSFADARCPPIVAGRRRQCSSNPGGASQRWFGGCDGRRKEDNRELDQAIGLGA
jgi:hypothetical protein